MRTRSIITGKTTLESEQVVFPIHEPGDMPDKRLPLAGIVPDDQSAHELEIRAFINKWTMMSFHDVPVPYREYRPWACYLNYKQDSPTASVFDLVLVLWFLHFLEFSGR
jgi:hypothetical protein